MSAALLCCACTVQAPRLESISVNAILEWDLVSIRGIPVQCLAVVI